MADPGPVASRTKHHCIAPRFIQGRKSHTRYGVRTNSLNKKNFDCTAMAETNDRLQ